MRSRYSTISAYSVLLAFVIMALLALSGHADIVIDLTHMGNPGNAPDYDHPYGPPYDPRYVGAVN